MSNSTVTKFPTGLSQYKITFDYLARPFVVVTLLNTTDPNLNVELKVGDDYVFLNPTTIQITRDQTGFDNVQIHRLTSTELLVGFRDGSVLTASDLTTSELQAIHIAEEGRDQSTALGKQYAAAAAVSASKSEALYNQIKEAGTYGYVVATDFATGGTLDTFNQVVRLGVSPTATYWRWDGDFPKVVTPGSTPSDTEWTNVTDTTLRGELSRGSGFEMIGLDGYSSLKDYLFTSFQDVNYHKSQGLTDIQALQAAINAGNAIVRSGTNLVEANFTSLVIPSNRTLVIENGASFTTNGRITAIGANNVKLIVPGKIVCTGQSAMPGVPGLPRIADGTQAADERGFIEFGGTVFAGNDGHDYVVDGCGTGRIEGYWSGTPNFDDVTRQLNRKGIAAWNCSRLTVKDIEISGFEGEQVYWFSRSEDNGDVLFKGIRSTMARFNALNINGYNAYRNIVVIDCYTEDSYNGIETSCGDLINTTHVRPVHTGVLFGLGSGGDNRSVRNNVVIDCGTTSYSLLYNKDYEGQGFVKGVVIEGNVGYNSGTGFMAVSSIEGVTIRNNTSYGLKAGRFLQVTTCQGGIVEGNVNYNPAVGTSHVYAADTYSLRFRNNAKIPLGDSYLPTALFERDIIGGLSGVSTSAGTRENALELNTFNPAVGTGGEFRWSYDYTTPFIAASISTAMRSYTGSGARADLQFNNLKINDDDVLGTSWLIKAEGHLLPGIDAFMNLGAADHRVNNSYFTVAPTVTSCETTKSKLEEVSEKEVAVGKELRSLFRKYKILSAIEVKGSNARWHFGIGAQSVRDVFIKHGLDPEMYGVWCEDVIVGEDGTKSTVQGIRYDELMSLIIASL